MRHHERRESYNRRQYEGWSVDEAEVAVENERGVVTQLPGQNVMWYGVRRTDSGERFLPLGEGDLSLSEPGASYPSSDSTLPSVADPATMRDRPGFDYGHDWMREFETCAVCREGRDRGRILSCVGWSFTVKRESDGRGRVRWQTDFDGLSAIGSSPSINFTGAIFSYEGDQVRHGRSLDDVHLEGFGAGP